MTEYVSRVASAPFDRTNTQAYSVERAASEILAAYRANAIAARTLEVQGRALVFRSADGWKPLCDFLGVEVPDEPYPKTNARAEFFAAVKSGTEEPAG